MSGNNNLSQHDPHNKPHTMIHQSVYQGPLPLASELDKYNKIITEGANRIMKMAEEQQAHRINLENMAIGEQLSQSKRGQWFAFILAVFLISAGTLCILKGHDTAGASLVISTLISLVIAFMQGKMKQDEDLKNKR